MYRSDFPLHKISHDAELKSNGPLVAFEATRIAFTEVIKIYFDLVTVVKELVVTLISQTQASIDSKSYSAGLPLLQSLKAFEVFDFSPDFDAHKETLRLQNLLEVSIICDCDEAKLAIEENKPGSVEKYNSTLQQVLCVSDLRVFDKLIDLDKVRTAKTSLVAHVGLVCDRATSKFKVMFDNRDKNLYTELKIVATTIDQLRLVEIVMTASSEQYHSLTDAVKASLDSFVSSFLAMMTPTHLLQISVEESILLQSILILVNDAKSLQGKMQSDYKDELAKPTAEIFRVVRCVSDHVKKGENGVLMSFKDLNTWKSLHSKRSAIQVLDKIIKDCLALGPVPDLLNFPELIQNNILICDKAVAKAAEEGIYLLRVLYTKRYAEL